jgi:hypothetical protein
MNNEHACLRSSSLTCDVTASNFLYLPFPLLARQEPSISTEFDFSQLKAYPVAVILFTKHLRTILRKSSGLAIVIIMTVASCRGP